MSVQPQDVADLQAAYTRWYRPLLAFARARGQDEDVVQDVFAELLSQGAPFDHSLLFWVLQRRCLDANRRAARRSAIAVLVPLDDDVARTIAVDGPDVDRVAADELLAQLDLLPRERLALRLVAAGYEVRDAAAALGTTKGGAASTLHRARAKAIMSLGAPIQAARCKECDRPRHAHGLCLRHYNARRYQQQRRQTAGGEP